MRIHINFNPIVFFGLSQERPTKEEDWRLSLRRWYGGIHAMRLLLRLRYIHIIHFDEKKISVFKRKI